MRDRGRVRWIKLLILVLALTASRANFPLLGASATAARDTSAIVVRSANPGKKGESVVPSRRMTETRRADWLRTLACQTHLSQLLKHALESVPDVGRFALRDLPRFESPPESTAPDYLRACSRAPELHSQPPPL